MLSILVRFSVSVSRTAPCVGMQAIGTFLAGVLGIVTVLASVELLTVCRLMLMT